MSARTDGHRHKYASYKTIAFWTLMSLPLKKGLSQATLSICLLKKETEKLGFITEKFRAKTGSKGKRERKKRYIYLSLLFARLLEHILSILL